VSISPDTTIKPKPRDRAKPLVLLAMLLLILAVYLFPAFQQQRINPTAEIRIFYMGTSYQTKAVYRGEEPYLPLDFLREVIDPNIAYDEVNQMVIITTSRNVYHLPVGSSEGLLNLEPYSFTYPVIQDEGITYLPADPLQDYYNLEIIADLEQNILRIYNHREELRQGVILQDTRSRIRAALPSPWTAKFTKDEEVYLLREERGWYWVEAPDGRLGYVAKTKLKLTGAKVWPQPDQSPYQPWNPLGQPIILTWEVAGNTTVNPQELGELTGVNVFSPTWFHLSSQGIIVNKADFSYVKWVHQRGGQVWGLFDNDFDPELTNKFLRDPSLRIRAIKQLLSYAEMYELDGFNIDFENMYLQDKAAFVQFIRELAPLLHEQERTLTVDVTFHSLSENWSLCYDRKALAESADYLAVMAYDENGIGSKKAGSVASLPWVERGLQRMLTEVPAAKLLLGIPFYTRLWTEEIQADGSVKVNSKALSMDKAAEWIKEQQAEIQSDEGAGQHYAEVKGAGITKRIWLEDSYSLQQRVELMNKYQLAGLAAWRRGFESAGTWQLISAFTNKEW